MKLYLMRHGPAEDQAPSGLDCDRALTPSGRDRVVAVARALAAADEVPHWIWTSPLVRAVQTAEIVAVQTKLSERGGTVQAKRELALGSEGRALINHVMNRLPKRVMLVGHEPDLSALAEDLLGAPLAVPFGKAMVVGVAIDHSQSTVLRFILDPKTLILERVRDENAT